MVAGSAYAGPAWTAPLTDAVTPDAFGSWASASINDTGTALSSNQAYSYDNAGRLTSVHDTKTGQCTTRSYAFTANSDRTVGCDRCPSVRRSAHSREPADRELCL